MSLAFLVGSAVCAAVVVWPRTGGVPYGLIFWGRVAAMGRADFVTSIADAAPEDLARERLEHCHAIAGTCARKYCWLRVSFVLGALALASSGVLRLVVGG